MKKPIAVMSAAALFASMAVTPVMAAETNVEVLTPETVVVKDADGNFVEVTNDNYNDAFDAKHDIEVAKVKVGDKYYSIDDYNDAFDSKTPLNPEVAEEGEGLLQGHIDDDGNVIVDEQPEDRLNETFFYNAA